MRGSTLFELTRASFQTSCILLSSGKGQPKDEKNLNERRKQRVIKLVCEIAAARNRRKITSKIYNLQKGGGMGFTPPHAALELGAKLPSHLRPHPRCRPQGRTSSDRTTAALNGAARAAACGRPRGAASTATAPQWHVKQQAAPAAPAPRRTLPAAARSCPLPPPSSFPTSSISGLDIKSPFLLLLGASFSTLRRPSELPPNMPSVFCCLSSPVLRPFSSFSRALVHKDLPLSLSLSL